MMDELMVRNLLGEDKFMELLIKLPDEYFELRKSTQDAVWKTILMKINEGINEVEQLVKYARIWMKLYQRVQETGLVYGINH